MTHNKLAKFRSKSVSSVSKRTRKNRVNDSFDLSLRFVLEHFLEMNKEEFAADLVCLLEEGTPRNVARLKAEIESYFVLGAALINMIAKVMDLDNSIGGHNFDVPLLHQTERAIAEFSQPEGMRLKNDHFLVKNKMITVLYFFNLTN